MTYLTLKFFNIIYEIQCLRTKPVWIKIFRFKKFFFIFHCSTYLTQRLKLYADDGKLIVELETDRDNDDIQAGINRTVEWCETWSMKLSPEKCKKMH